MIFYYFYHNEKQKETAEKTIKELETNQTYKGTIVTQIEPLKSFYEAENYHDKNRSAGYCRVVIGPKIHKLYKDFGEILSKDGPFNRGD